MTARLRVILWAAAMASCGEADDASPAPDVADTEAPRACGVVDDVFESDCRPFADYHADLCGEPTGTCLVPASNCHGGFCAIPAATYLMGPLHTNSVRWQEMPLHPVTITRPFIMHETEVTLAAWLAVMGGETPARYAYPDDHPVTGIGFFDAVAFANELSAREGRPECYTLEGCDGSQPFGRVCHKVRFAGPDCTGYRLPSEAEWELAAGLGLGRCHPDHHVSPVDQVHFDGSCSWWADPPFPLRFCHNASVDYEGCIDMTGIDGPACAGPGPVREYPPNAFGLYAMGGNVQELTGSRYRWPRYFPAPTLELGHEVDPGFDELPIDGDEDDGLPQGVAVRGGGFNQSVAYTCVYSRGGILPIREASPFVGFRLVRTLGSDAW